MLVVRQSSVIFSCILSTVNLYKTAIYFTALETLLKILLTLFVFYHLYLGNLFRVVCICILELINFMVKFNR